MPIAQPKPEVKKGPAELPVQITAPEYRGKVVDTHKNPLSEIMMYVEGSSWTVNYYSQVLGKDDELSDQQVSMSAANQQYVLTQALELKVSSQLSTSSDAQSTEVTMTGSAVIYAGIIPNKGDVFLADIGDGREGVLTVTQVERKTILKGTAYEISYAVTGYNVAERRFDLDRKTIKVVHFRRDLIKYGQKPVLIPSEVATLEQFEKFLREFKAQYFSRFFSTEYQTLLLPNQRFTVYDPFLTKAVLALFNTDEHPLLRKIKVLNIAGDEAMNCFQFWNCLLTLNDDLHSILTQEMFVVRSQYFMKSPAFMSIYHSGVSYVVYPKGGRIDIDKQYVHQCERHGEAIIGGQATLVGNDCLVMTLIEAFDLAAENITNTDLDPTPLPDGASCPIDSELADDPVTEPLLDTLLDVTELLENDTFVTTPEPDPLEEVVDETIDLFDQYNFQPLIHSVTIDDCYVFSKWFYERAEQGQSKLEVQTNLMLQGKSVDLDVLTAICEDVKNWGLLERFYYVPVLMVLIKVAIRSM